MSQDAEAGGGAGQQPPASFPGQQYPIPAEYQTPPTMAAPPYPAAPGYPPPPGYPGAQQYPPQYPNGPQYPGAPGHPVPPGYPGAQPPQGPWQPGGAYPAGQPIPTRGPGKIHPALIIAPIAGLLVVVAVISLVVIRMRSDDTITAGATPGAPHRSSVATAPDTPTTATSEGSSPSDSPSTTAAAPSSALPTSTDGARVGSAIAMAKGDCIKELPTTATVSQLILVNCTAPHEAQVGYTFSPSSGSWPGTESLGATSDQQCPDRLSKVIRSDAPPLNFSALTPEESEWDAGDHSIKCILISRDGSLLTRSVVS